MTANSSNTPTKCGTPAGYSRHYKLKEEICQPCRDARNSYRSSYYKKYPEKKRAMDLRYLEKHPGQRNKYDQKYRDNNRAKTKAASLKWNKEHPEQMRLAQHSRRARKLLNGHEPYTEAQVLDLYGINCHLCEKPIDITAPRRIGKKEGWQLSLHIDHVIPIIAGGPDTLNNVRPAHAICNMQKGARMTEEFEQELDPSLFEDDEIIVPEDYDDHLFDEDDLASLDEPEKDDEDAI